VSTWLSPENDALPNSANQLLSSAKGGSTDCLGSLLFLYRNYLLSVAQAELGDDLRAKLGASDLLQETFLEAGRDFESFSGTDLRELQSWLRRILLNNLANSVRSYRSSEMRDVSREVNGDSARSDPLFSRLKSPVETPSRCLMNEEMLGTVRAAVQRLPEQYQSVVILRNYDRLPFEEIGTRIGRTPEAARKLWCRAIKLLQDELEATYDTFFD
jgi:RNA polymerase sigma-70 factor, ECF subfamily